MFLSCLQYQENMSHCQPLCILRYPQYCRTANVVELQKNKVFEKYKLQIYNFKINYYSPEYSDGNDTYYVAVIRSQLTEK